MVSLMATKHICKWFAGCTREAVTTVWHPVLGDVPVCAECDKFASGETLVTTPRIEPTELSVCADCVYVLANGAENEEQEAAADAIAGRYTAGELVPGGDDLGFSWSQCEGCLSTLGGDRFTAYYFPEG